MINYNTGEVLCQEDLDKILGEHIRDYFGEVKEHILDIVSSFAPFSQKPSKIAGWQVLKKYGDKNKLIIMSKPHKQRTKPKEEWQENEDKLLNNISRSKSTVFELALCNPWEMFFTFTIDKRKYDRYNLPPFYKDLGKWLSNQSRYTEDKIAYLTVPEQHTDGAWHFHGLINSIPPQELQPLTWEYLTSKGVKWNESDQKLIDRGDVLVWDKYWRKYGRVTLSYVRDPERIATYISQYINESMAKTNIELGNHLFYSTRGLKRAEVVLSGWNLVKRLPKAMIDKVYEGEYCSVVWVK